MLVLAVDKSLFGAGLWTAVWLAASAAVARCVRWSAAAGGSRRCGGVGAWGLVGSRETMGAMASLRELTDRMLARLPRGKAGGIGLPGEPEDGWLTELPPGPRALVEAGWAALVSSIVVVVGVLIGWLAGAAGSGSGWAALLFGFDMWLFIQGVPLRVNGETISLIPWLFAVLPLASLAWASLRVVPLLEHSPSDDRTRAGTRRDVAIVGGAFVGGYALIATLLALVARTGAVASTVWFAPFGPAALAALAFTWALRRRFGADTLDLFPRLAWHWRVDVPEAVRRVVRPALAGVVALFAVGLVMAVAMIAVNLDRIGVVNSYVDPGIVGGSLFTLGQAAYLPTAASWAVGFMSGPGFSIGEGTLVSWGSAQIGPLPLVPVLGALPDPGDLPAWTFLTVLVPVLVGAVVAWRSLRLAPAEVAEGDRPGWRSKVITAASAPAITGVVTALLCAMAGGSLGGQRLAHVGVNGFVVGAALVLELLLGAAIALGISQLTKARLTKVPEPAA